AEFIRLAGLLRADTEQIRKGMDVAFRNNKPGTLKKRLEVPLRDYDAAAGALQAALAAVVVGPPTVRTTADDFGRVADKSLSACFALWDRDVQELDELLQARIDRDAGRKHLVYLLAAVFLILVLGFQMVAFWPSKRQA